MHIYFVTSKVYFKLSMHCIILVMSLRSSVIVKAKGSIPNYGQFHLLFVIDTKARLTLQFSHFGRADKIFLEIPLILHDV